MRRILVIFLGAVVCLMPNSPPADAENANKWFNTLMKASEFADGEIGEGPYPSDCYLAYREALVEPDKITEKELHELHKSATPEGKLYAACLSYYAAVARKNAADADAELKSLIGDKSKVFYRSGCRGTNSTVGEVASALLNNRKFILFELSDLATVKHTAGIPNPLLKLSSAKRLESGVIGEGSRSVLYAYYNEARHLPLKATGRELNWLRNNGTPAGKLYACFLAMKLDEAASLEMFRKLEGDTSKVQYQSGCEVMDYTVGAIAREVVKNRKFADFQF